MKTRTHRFVLLFLLPLTVYLVLEATPGAADEKKPATSGDVHVQVLQGKVALKEGFDNRHEVKLGRTLQGVAKLGIIEWFGGKAISGQLDVKNPSRKPVFLSYSLAFFDAGGVMLGCSSQTMDVGAGDKTAIGGALVRMPLAQLKKVASYRITYYEDHEDIGKR